MRFVAAVQERQKGGDQLVEQVSRELWRRIWCEDKDITEPASLAEVLTYAAKLHLRKVNLLIKIKEFCYTWFFSFFVGSEESRIA